MKKTRRTSSQERKRLVKKLDILFSEYIRLRDKRAYGGCFFCGKPIQHVFHVITRSKRAVRWDDRNGLGSCAGCNLRFEHDTVFIFNVQKKYIETFGQVAFDDLMRLGSSPARHSLDDLRAIKKKLEDNYAGICVAHDLFGRKA